MKAILLSLFILALAFFMARVCELGSRDEKDK